MTSEPIYDGLIFLGAWLIVAIWLSFRIRNAIQTNRRETAKGQYGRWQNVGRGR